MLWPASRSPTVSTVALCQLINIERVYYTFRDSFFKGPNDPDITGVEVYWKYDRAKRIRTQKRSDKWMRYEPRPQRPVHYFSVRKDSFSQRLNWGFLPGQDSPERWGLGVLDCRERHELLGNELNATATVAAEHIEWLRSLPDKDHRQLSYELGQRIRISAEDALRMLAKSISPIPSNPLKCVQEVVKAPLDGKRVQGGTVLQ
jgi:hypothetical protein